MKHIAARHTPLTRHVASRRVFAAFILGAGMLVSNRTALALASSDEQCSTACLQRAWLHAHEEDTPEITVYRPADDPFPPSRGRIGYEFLAGGDLVYQGIAPGDGPQLSPGRWELISPGAIAIEIEEPGQPIVRETLSIISCSDDRLEIAR